jgi:hypothetical protein
MVQGHSRLKKNSKILQASSQTPTPETFENLMD